MTPNRRLAWGALAFAAVVLVAAAALAVVALRGPGAPTTMNDRVRAVAATLRCPVCQNLSVADSPSRLAQQMRATIAQELEAGRSPEQIRAEFAASYGEWILLAPPKDGIDLIAWLAPLVLVVAGLAVAVFAVRRWTSQRHGQDERRSILTPSDRRLLDRAMRASVEEPE